MFWSARITKRADGKQWNRSSLLRAVAEELHPLQTEVSKNSFKVIGEFTYQATFFVQNYKESDELWLGTESTNLLPPHTDIAPPGFLLWPAFSLENLRQLFPKDNRKSLSVKLDEDFESSRLKKDIDEIYRPLLKALTRYETCFAFMAGEQIQVGKFAVTCAKLEANERAWYLLNAYSLAKHYKDADRQLQAWNAIERAMKEPAIKDHLSEAYSLLS